MKKLAILIFQTLKSIARQRLIPIIISSVCIAAVLLMCGVISDSHPNKSFPFYLLGAVGFLIYIAIFCLVITAEVSDEELPYQDGAFCALYVVVFLILILYYSMSWWIMGGYGSKLACANMPLCDFKEALYFSIATSTTLGYGDLAPVTDAAKIFAAIQVLTSSFFSILIFSLLLTKRRAAGTISHVCYRTVASHKNSQTPTLGKIERIPLSEWANLVAKLRTSKQKFQYSFDQGKTRSWIDG